MFLYFFLYFCISVDSPFSSFVPHFGKQVGNCIENLRVFTAFPPVNPDLGFFPKQSILNIQNITAAL